MRDRSLLFGFIILALLTGLSMAFVFSKLERIDQPLQDLQRDVRNLEP